MEPREKLKDLRGRLTQAEFGSKYGFEPHTVGFMETGKQQIPDELALKLEEEYGIPFKWWKTGKGEPTAEPVLLNIEDCLSCLQKELDLTENEIKLIINDIKKDKVPYILLARARTGDGEAAELLRKILNTD